MNENESKWDAPRLADLDLIDQDGQPVRAFDPVGFQASFNAAPHASVSAHVVQPEPARPYRTNSELLYPAQARYLAVDVFGVRVNIEDPEQVEQIVSVLTTGLAEFRSELATAGRFDPLPVEAGVDR